MNNEDLGDSSVNGMLDGMASASLVSLHGVQKRSDPNATMFVLPVGDAGVTVTLGHSHEAHLWLDVAGTWRTDTVEGDLDGLLDEWRDLIELAKRIASGKEFPIMDADAQIWFSSGGYGFRRLRKDV